MDYITDLMHEILKHDHIRASETNVQITLVKKLRILIEICGTIHHSYMQRIWNSIFQ